MEQLTSISIDGGNTWIALDRGLALRIEDKDTAPLEVDQSERHNIEIDWQPDRVRIMTVGQDTGDLKSDDVMATASFIGHLLP